MQGIITKGIGGFYYIKAEDCRIYECRARGIFRKDNIKPMIGDRVEISVENGKGNIEKIFERKSYLIRPAVANIDSLIIVAAAKDPYPDYYLTDKLLLMAELSDISPAICINKTDLESSLQIRNVYKETGYPIFEICARDNIIPDDLISYLTDKTTAFAGLSGVGKSSILTLITGKSVETGEISNKINRGKHTTRHIELFELENGGYVLDTPGFSSYEPDIIDASKLGLYFPEIKNLHNLCRFKGCAHINEPDCRVKLALEQGKISAERYESYKKMYEILKNHKKWE